MSNQELILRVNISLTGNLPLIHTILSQLHPFCLWSHRPPIYPSISLSLYSSPLHVDEPFPQGQLTWIKYSTCQVASLDESCSQASSARGEDQWVCSACTKKGKPCHVCRDQYLCLAERFLLRTQQWDRWTATINR